MTFNGSTPAPRLVSLATAVPPFDLPQHEVAARAATVFAPTPGGFHRLAPIYINAMIDRRHACVPIEWFLEEHGFRERNALFLHHATELLAEAAGKALAEANLAPGDIDTIVTVCTSGIATPGLDARLMGRLDFRSDVQRLPVFRTGLRGRGAGAVARGGHGAGGARLTCPAAGGRALHPHLPRQ